MKYNIIPQLHFEFYTFPLNFNEDGYLLGVKFAGSDYISTQDLYSWNYEVIVIGMSPVIILFMTSYLAMEPKAETRLNQEFEHKQEEKTNIQDVELALGFPPGTRHNLNIIDWAIVYEKNSPDSGFQIRRACTGNNNYMLTSIEEPGKRGAMTIGIVESATFSRVSGHLIPYIQAPPGVRFTSNGLPIMITNDAKMFIHRAPRGT